METETTPVTPLPSPPPTPSIKPPGINNALLTIMAVCLLIATALAGLFYFQIQKLSKELTQLQTQPSPTPTATPDVTANWKTYTDPQKNFFLKYPENLVSKPSQEKLFLYVEGFTPTESENFVPNITIGNRYEKPDKFTNLVSWAESNEKIFPSLAKNSEVTLGNTIFTTFESDSGPSAYSVHYLINDDVNIYDFSVRIVGSNENAGKQLLTYIQQILSTFRFLDQSDAEGKFCGGIAGVICPESYSCKLDGDYPDAGGVCTKN